jgi:hypothetical protein
VNYCDFKDLEWGVYNVNRSFNIDARNNWWGNNSGPMHAGNPGGNGAKATDSVQYTPWLVNGSNNPIMGDVSLNGLVQAFDAALVLQSNVSLITLNGNQNTVADVTGNGTISAMDASYILQFVTGLINKFPAEELNINPIFPDVTNARFVLGQAQAQPLSNVVLPLEILAADGIYSVDLTLTMDPALLQFQAVQGLLPGLQLSQQYDPMSGTLRLSIAGLQQLRGNVQLLQLAFNTGQLRGSSARADVDFDVAIGNETNLVAQATHGGVDILALTTSVDPSSSHQVNSLLPVYPNPIDGEAVLRFTLDRRSDVVLEVSDLQGRTLMVMQSGQLDPGSHQFRWDGRDADGRRLASGVYLVRLSTASRQSVQRIIVK